MTRQFTEAIAVRTSSEPTTVRTRASAISAGPGTHLGCCTPLGSSFVSGGPTIGSEVPEPAACSRLMAPPEIPPAAPPRPLGDDHTSQAGLVHQPRIGRPRALARPALRYHPPTHPVTALPRSSWRAAAMRTIVTLLLLLAAAPVIALAQAEHAPPSAANLVRFRPAPWQPPIAMRAGMRFEPETGEASVVEGSRAPGERALASSQASARALAAANVSRRADGSRHAVVGSAFRSWTVVTIDDGGQLKTDCVSSDAEARARVDAAAQKQVRK